MKKTSVVIVGGGFAGLSAAMYLDKTLARRADIEVTLISRESFILFTPMLHEVASGDLYPGNIVNPIRRIHPGDFLLPELGQELGDYAERKLRERKVDVIKGVRVASYDGSLVTLTDGNTIPTSTLIWTAGVKPSPVIAPLPCLKERGRLLISEYLAVTGVPGLWAAGDCAAVPVSNTENFHPPTAQHGLREGLVAAKNIAAVVLDRPLKSFTFTTLGQLATIGRRTGVAMVFGIKFAGFIAWVLWRTVYLMKLPRLPKKFRVMVGWTLDLLFARDIEQMITLRDVEALSDLASRLRVRATQRTSATAAPTLEAAVHDQLN
jgi:NADH dehydrogenase